MQMPAWHLLHMVSLDPAAFDRDLIFARLMVCFCVVVVLSVPEAAALARVGLRVNVVWRVRATACRQQWR